MCSSTRIASFLLIAILAAILSSTLKSPSLASDQAVELPPNTRMISYIETGVSKDRVETYRNKVFLAEDGRKRVEHLTSKRNHISIFDDWGIQRLYLFPTTKTATVFEELEKFADDPTKLQQWVDGYRNLVGGVTSELRPRKLDGIPIVGLSATTHDFTVTLWVEKASGSPIRIGIDRPEQYTSMSDFQFFDTFDETLFDFDAPDGYTVAKHTWKEEKRE